MHVLIHIGSRSKQRYDDEIECIEIRRRSSRIVALEEKRQQEIEREIAVELERKNKPINHDIRNKGKGKAIMKVSDDSSDLNKDEEGPIWQGCKNKELHQLLSSIKVCLNKYYTCTISPFVMKKLKVSHLFPQVNILYIITTSFMLSLIINYFCHSKVNTGIR